MINIAKNKNDTSLNTIKACFNVILSGEKEDSRLAARCVRKLLYSSQGRDKFEDIRNVINSAQANYIMIAEEWRQENFVTAVSVIQYLHNREAEPDFLFPWLFQLLEHPKGNIRFAAVKMFSHEIWPLTVHLRIPGYKSDRLKPEQSDRILQALVICLNSVSARLWEPKYKRYTYIDSLPACSYKSVQMVIAELKDASTREL